MRKSGIVMFTEIHKELYSVLPFVLHTVGQYPCQASMVRPDGFETHQFIWVREGSGEFCVRDERFILEKGEGVFLRAGVPHSYHGKPFHTMWCTFILSDAMLDHIGVADWMRFEVPSYLNRETEQLYHFAVGDSTVLSRSAAGYSYVTELFASIMEPKDSPAVRVVRFMEQHYGESLTLDDIAAEAGMDRFAFCHYFTKERGVTVMEELFRIRIAKAKHLLKYSADSVETVGRSCGFGSASYFGKRFRESVGCAPAEYRKRNSCPPLNRWSSRLD